MGEGKKNVITILLVLAILTTALVIRFTPGMSFQDILRSLVELPQNVFSFVWEKPAEQEIELQEEPPRKEETPLVLFGNGTEEPQVILPPTTDGTPTNELPMDVFTEGETP